MCPDTSDLHQRGLDNLKTPPLISPCPAWEGMPQCCDSAEFGFSEIFVEGSEEEEEEQEMRGTKPLMDLQEIGLIHLFLS